MGKYTEEVFQCDVCEKHWKVNNVSYASTTLFLRSDNLSSWGSAVIPHTVNWFRGLFDRWYLKENNLSEDEMKKKYNQSLYRPNRRYEFEMCEHCTEKVVNKIEKLMPKD